MVKWEKELRGFGFKEVLPLDFYRSIFPEGELQKKGIYEMNKYCGIAVEIIENKDSNIKIKRYNITDDLEIIKELLKSPNFVIISPISYIGKKRLTENTRKMYAFALEIDNLKVDKEGAVGINDLIHQMQNRILPQANYIVCSGSGIHLYFLLEEPIRLFDNVRKSLSRYKKFITRQFWNRYITFDYTIDKIQFESAFQGFRLAGGFSKAGERTKIFELSTHPTTIEELNSFVYDEKGIEDQRIKICYDNKLTLKQAKDKYPEWYEKRIINKSPKQSWIVKRALYDWWLKKIKEEVKVGHRYYVIMLLAVYALKCNISFDELEKDAFSLLEDYDRMSNSANNRFKKSDILSALQIFEDKDYITLPVNSIAKLSGIKIEKNKRNGRKQAVHLMLARGQLSLLRKLGEVKEGRPVGSGTKEDYVKNYIKEHPEENPTQIAKALNISRTTVYKYLK